MGTLATTILGFGGLVGLAYMIASPIGAAVVLLLISPFDAIWFAFFGVLGNLVTYFPIGAFLLRTGPSKLGRALVGTRIQVAATVYVALTFFSHLMIVDLIGAQVVLVYARLVTGLLIVALVAWSVRTPQNMALCVKVYVFASMLFVLLAMSDFYLGTGIMPAFKEDAFTGGITAEEFQTNRLAEYRLTGGGLPVNRFANSLVLPTILAMGWFYRGSRGQLGRALAFGSFGILVGGVLGSISRSAMVGIAVGSAIVLVRAFRIRPATVLALGLAGGLVFAGGSQLARRFGVDQAISERLDTRLLSGSAVSRFSYWAEALRVFAASPLIGVGPGNIKHFTLEHGLGGTGKNPHNAYLLVLAQFGIFGFLAFAAMVALVLLRVVRAREKIPPEAEYWRPFVFAGVCALLAANLFNDYMHERVFWVMVGFAAGFEHYDREVRRKRVLERREELGPGFGSSPDPLVRAPGMG